MYILLNTVIINIAKVLFPQAYVTLADFGYPVYRPFGFIVSKTLNYLAFQSFDLERI